MMNGNMCRENLIMDISYIQALEDKISVRGIAWGLAYHTQQLIEKILRLVARESGKRIIYPHDIETLMANMPEEFFTDDVNQQLKLKASTISSWEEKVRYDSDLKIDESFLKESIDLAFEMLKQYGIIIEDLND